MRKIILSGFLLWFCCRGWEPGHRVQTCACDPALAVLCCVGIAWALRLHGHSVRGAIARVHELKGRVGA